MTSRRTDRAVTTRPECADGCPLTDTSGCATGCVRAPSVPAGTCECGQGPATVEVVPGYLTCEECAGLWSARLTASFTAPGNVGTEPAPAEVPPPASRPDHTEPVPDADDDPFTWAPYLALLAVIIAATVCALAGWTR
jgi:hypothetical protein